jgi:hypothetical protein
MSLDDSATRHDGNGPASNGPASPRRRLERGCVQLAVNHVTFLPTAARCALVSPWYGRALSTDRPDQQPLSGFLIVSRRGWCRGADLDFSCAVYSAELVILVRRKTDTSSCTRAYVRSNWALLVGSVPPCPVGHLDYVFGASRFCNRFAVIFISYAKSDAESDFIRMCVRYRLDENI